ncbi:MAG: ATP-binding protein, partial [Thermoflexales bacterium]|nr:ATP-binding protein [Thermoflexales bacterium]
DVYKRQLPTPTRWRRRWSSRKQRAVVGHTQTVLDPEAVRFAARLYAELTDGYPLREAVSRAQRAVTTHEVVLLGDDALRFEHLTRSEPWIDERQPRGNLPARSKFFFGRGRELVRLAQRLAQPPCVVVLSGAPAIGKTSLALEAANRNAWRFPGGVAYAACPDDAPSTAADLFNQLAEGLQVQPQSFAPKAVSAELVAYARLQPTLFVLDNAHALPEGELVQVQQFLRQLGGGSAAIIVSRLSLLLEKVPAAAPLLVHQGVGTQAATYQALYLARQRNIPLETSEAQEIAVASDGHPRLVECWLCMLGGATCAQCWSKCGRARATSRRSWRGSTPGAPSGWESGIEVRGRRCCCSLRTSRQRCCCSVRLRTRECRRCAKRRWRTLTLRFRRGAGTPQ